MEIHGLRSKAMDNGFQFTLATDTRQRRRAGVLEQTRAIRGKVILDKVIAIQKLPDEDKTCIMYSIDGLIQHAKTRKAYAK